MIKTLVKRYEVATVLVPVLIAIALPAVTGSPYVGTLCLIWAMAALGLRLLWGQTGLMSFCQNVFFGLGAYGSALVILRLQGGFYVALGSAVLAGVCSAVILGSLMIHRRGVYFILLSFAFAAMAAASVFLFPSVTGGENGLTNVVRPPVSFFGLGSLAYDQPIPMYAVAATLFVLVYVFIIGVTKSRLGRTLNAIRENEDRARAIGYATQWYKLVAFAISGGITGVAGFLYALLLYSVPESTMQVATSADILVMTILGGRGSALGSVLGAVGVTILSDQMSLVWPRWRIVLGLLLIPIALFLPQGLSGGVTALTIRAKAITTRLARMVRRAADEGGRA